MCKQTEIKEGEEKVFINEETTIFKCPFCNMEFPISSSGCHIKCACGIWKTQEETQNCGWGCGEDTGKIYIVFKDKASNAV